VLTTRFDDAFRYAHALHQHQLRKGTTIPYITHLMAVAALVVEHGGDEDQAIAGLLHDAAEDQGGAATLAQIRARFGDAVADIVADCTDAWTEPKPPWRARKEAYLRELPSKPPASLLVSLADKTHNAEAIRFDYRVLAMRCGRASTAERREHAGTMARWRNVSRRSCPAASPTAWRGRLRGLRSEVRVR
jgi:(p)ppGpp synthase/HD superfamily hydrolase